ncbi:MAG: hypothetical protein JXQ90_07155 [Cyclobacteriaceae bacterium]
MLTKEIVIKAINKLPGEFSVDQVIDELLLLEKIERGLNESKLGHVVSDKELDNELPKWLN